MAKCVLKAAQRPVHACYFQYLLCHPRCRLPPVGPQEPLKAQGVYNTRPLRVPLQTAASGPVFSSPSAAPCAILGL